MAEIKHVVVISDTHCGSTIGLLPKGFRSAEGNTIGQNAIQEHLWDRWLALNREWIPDIVGNHPYVVVFNGDATDGNHHNSRQLISPHEHDHVEAARLALEPLADRASDFVMIRGTECHVGQSASLEEEVMWRVRDMARKPRLDDEPLTFFHAKIRLGDHLIDFAHHVGASSAMIPGLPGCAKILAKQLIESAKWDVQAPSVVVRSHVHSFATAATATARGTMRATITPAWQALTAFGWKVVPDVLPQLGAVALSLGRRGEIYQREIVWPIKRAEPLKLRLKSSRTTSAAFSGKSSSRQAKARRATD